jgi:hypothetical protein
MMPKAFVAFWAFLAGHAARAARPHFLPLHVAPEGIELAAQLKAAYEKEVIVGYLSARQIITKGAGAGGKKGLKKGAICQNMREVGKCFDIAARTLDPDGLASEIVKLFCVGVPHMKELDNRRRVVTVWSALLAPAVVQRHAQDLVIRAENILEMGSKWLEVGTTDEAHRCAERPDTRFIAAHPARIYDLLVDTAAKHELDLSQLLASVVRPVVLGVAQHVGALQAANGRVVQELDELLQKVESE